MARIHNGIQYYTKLIEGFRRALGERGEWGIERAGETLTPTLDFWSQPEWAFLRGERLAAFRSASAAVVAEFSGVALINQAARNELFIIDAAKNRAAATSALRIATQAVIEATFAGVTDAFRRDTRVTNAIQPDRIRTGSDGGQIGNQIDETATDTAFANLPVILSPGFGLIVQCQTVNTAIVATMKYRVRTLLPGEL